MEVSLIIMLNVILILLLTAASNESNRLHDHKANLNQFEVVNFYIAAIFHLIKSDRIIISIGNLVIKAYCFA